LLDAARRIAPPAKQAFVLLFPAARGGSARRAIHTPYGDLADWVLIAGVHVLPGAYFANGFPRPAAGAESAYRLPPQSELSHLASVF